MCWWEIYPWTNLHDLNLDWVIEVCQKALKEVEGFPAQIEDLQSQIDSANGDIDKIKKYLASNEFINQNLSAIETYIQDNLPDIVSQYVKYIFFGLTDDGHFAAYIPDSWDFISFDTGADPSDTERYGHLILKY